MNSKSNNVIDLSKRRQAKRKSAGESDLNRTRSSIEGHADHHPRGLVKENSHKENSLPSSPSVSWEDPFSPPLSEEGFLFQGDAPIVDMTERRNEQILRERRLVKRTILTEFVGAFVVVPQKGLLKVSLYDISENGLAFDVETNLGKFAKGEELAMRVYLNQHTYFPFIIKVRNVRQEGDENSFRHGADFVKGSVNSIALRHFVKFIETVSASLERDGGDVMVSNLKE